MYLLGKGRVFTRSQEQPYIENGGIVYDGSTIIEVGDFTLLKEKYPQAELIDARGQIIMPGFINAHHHIYSAFARGLALNGYNPSNFLEILDGMWWRMDRSLNVADSKASAAAVYLSCIENGVTTIFDHHASYGETEGSLAAIAEEAKRFGVRSCLCYEISDRNGEAEMKKAVRENLRFAREAAKDESQQVLGLIGLHASFTLSDQTLDYIVSENTDKVGYHVHVAEAKLDQESCLKEHGMRVVPRLDRFGILNEKSIAGHCVHITDEEREMIAARRAMVVHNPQSNMGNAIGAPDILAQLKSGILLGLGTDGFTSDMLESIKFANLLVKHEKQDATVGFNEVSTMLFENNAKMVERSFGIKTGQLKAGYKADIIVLEYDEITPLHAENLNGHLIFGMNGRNVVTTVANGVLRMKDRILQNLDHEQIVAYVRETAAAFADKVNR